MKLLSFILPFGRSRLVRSGNPPRIVIRGSGCAAVGLSFLLSAFRAWSADCVSPPAGLVAWWPGGGSANDIAGTNDGVLEGGVAFAGGEVGQSFSFNGSSADVRVPASASLNVGLADGFTIETWINPADITQRRQVVEWNNGTFGVTFVVGDSSGGGPGSLFISVKDTSYNDHIISTAGGLLFSNIWQHVAATYVRSNGSTVLYINGVQRAQATLGVFTPRTIGDLYVGVRPSEGVSGRFVGLMDEVSLYNRTLSAAEIQAIYNASSAGKCAVPVITSHPRAQVGYWGKSVTFNVHADGSPPLYYQWLKDNVPIGGHPNHLSYWRISRRRIQATTRSWSRIFTAVLPAATRT